MFFFVCKQKTAYELRISDWISDVCSSDLIAGEEGAQLTHIRLQDEAAGIYHAALGQVTVAGDARYAHVSIQAGGAMARHELQIDYTGPNAEVDVQGLVLARGASHIDHTLYLHHAVPDGRSNQQIGRASCRERVWPYV